ncbi:MAG TPA: diaminopropionate ammonia-lyase [Thermomicrobiales bacterium]|nr:diaminopropionate ammonia-lyase [Thermomicrobiales bacterium]
MTIANDTTARALYNRIERDATVGASPGREPMAFHQRLTGYAPTPLVDAPELAERLGVGAVLVKDESSRIGLPAFKILGASWAVYRALEQRVGGFQDWDTLDDLAAQLEPLRPLTLAAATDGNHGRAVARMARLLGFASRIYVPDDMVQPRRDAIASEGAEVVVVHGTYDDAIAQSAREADERSMVISDTSWPGYEDVPRWVIDGYSTILREVDDELAARGEAPPDLVAVQIGVGALASAVVTHYRQPGRPRPAILGVEPSHAACTLASMEAGEVVTIAGPHDSIMAGLNCGEPSMLAWPLVSSGIDAFVAVDDEWAREGMRALARHGVVAGETGAAGLAGLLGLFGGPERERSREHLGVNDSSRVLIFVTEGATDPEAYARIVGSAP